MNCRPLPTSSKHSVAMASVLITLFIAISPASAQNRATGTIAGTFDVSPMGSANYSIPLRIAPGTGGTEPKLLLTYDSQASGGPVGAGWSITGLSTITRGPRSIYFDGRMTGVELTDEDALYLDGQRLLPVSQTGSGDTRRIEYRKRLDDTTRITQVGANLESSSFTAETKGGLRLIFDGTNDSRIRLSDGTTLLLAVSRIVDTVGNFIQFRYGQNGSGDYNIISIQYTGNDRRKEKPYASVNFEYESIARSWDSYIAGRLIKRSSRLKAIVSAISPKRGGTPTATAARYTFEYEDRDTANRFVLTAVHQFGEDNAELEPTHFSYSKPQTEWALAGFQLPVDAFAIREQLGRAYRFADFVPSQAGQPPLPDLLFAAQVEGKLEAFAYRNDGGTWSPVESFKPPFAFSLEDGSDLGSLVIDLNGDGRADLLKSYRHGSDSPERLAFLAGSDKWELADGYQLPFNLSENGQKIKVTYFFVRLTGAAGPDLIFESEGSRKFLKNTGSGWAEDTAHAPPEALTSAARMIDVDCDGKAELALPSTSSGTPHWNIYRYDNSGWTLLTNDAFSLPYAPDLAPDASRQVDINGDRCSDLITANGQTGLHAAFTASPTGWVKNDQMLPPFDLIDANGTTTDASFIDLDSDGRADVIAGWINSSGTLSVFAYRQTNTGWEQLQSKWLPVASIDHNSASVFADIDGDGRPDLLMPAGQRNGFGRILAGTSAGFVEKPSFAPPMAFARKDQQDRGVRLIDLNADGLPDVIFSRELTRDGKVQTVAGAFLNTGHGWISAPGLTPPLPFAAEYIAGVPYQFVDVDSDGYIDILYSNRRSDGTVSRAYYRNEVDDNGNRKWTNQIDSPFVPPANYPFAQEKTGDLGIRFADLNGDGRVDMLSGVVNESCFRVFNLVQCKLDPSVYEAKTFLNNGSGWVESNTFASPLPFVFRGPNVPTNAALFVELLDINGDGLPDVIGRFKHPFDATKEVSEVWLNTGTGWAGSAIQAPIFLDAIRRTPKSSIQWMDMNGDGLIDIVWSERVGGTNKSATWLSTGRGFIEAPQWQIPIDAIADRDADQSFRLLDLNGDGYVDILYSRTVSNAQVERGAYLNNGSGWKSLDLKGLAIPAFTTENGSDEGVRLFDVDGNGLPDVLRSFASGDTAVAEQQVLLNRGRRADLLEKIDVGYDLATNITYQTMLEVADNSGKVVAPWSGVYVPGSDRSNYPIIAAVPTSYLVKRVAVEEGKGKSVGFSYHYGDYRLHMLALQPLGFRWRETYNEVTGIVSRSEYAQDVRLIGRTQREANCYLPSVDRPDAPLSADSFTTFFADRQNLCPDPPVASPRINILREQISQWKIVEDAGAATSNSGVYQVQLVENQSSSWELDGVRVSKERTTLTYDDTAQNLLDRHQNVITSRTERMDGSYVETNNEYAQDNAEQWFFGRLTKVTTKNVGDVATPSTERKVETRASSFTYDPDTGLLLSEVTGLSSPAPLTKTYTRDAYGNIKSVVLSADNEQQRRSENRYDVLGRFVSIFTNAKNQKVRTEKASLTTGRPLVIIDSNGLKEEYTYDGFGRTIVVKAPTGIITTTKYLTLSELNDPHLYEGVSAASAVTVTTANLPRSVRLMDNKGRVIRTVDEGFTGDGTTPRPIHRDYVYDLAGRNTQTSLPYDRGGPVRWMTTRFDALNRSIEVKGPDGRAKTYTYAGRPRGGRLVIVSDPLQRKTATEYNERGLLISVEDALKGRVSYVYDGGDRPELITGPTGQITRKKFDHLGHPLQITDPDTGTTDFEYNAFGELIRERKAAGQEIRFEYDELGRSVRKSTSDNDYVEITYDSAPRGVGKLAKVVIPNRFEKNFTYDSVGRLTGLSESIEKETFNTFREFDNLGRLWRTTYPSPQGQAPVVIQNAFDKKGFLHRVTSRNGLTLYWEALEMDPAGTVTEERYGNDVTTTRIFNPDTGRLERIHLEDQANTRLLDLNLNYDANGNLRDRNEMVESIKEHFDYDEVNRLTSYRDTSGSTVQIKYDPAGRIASKTGIGSYFYADSMANTGNWQPTNAVARIGGGGPDRTYTYDDNGNLIRALNSQYKYSADNLLSQIDIDQDHWSRFDYDPDGQRYRQTSRNGEVIREALYIGAFELVRDFRGDSFKTAKPTSIRYRYTLSTPNGVFATLQLDVKPQPDTTASDSPSSVGPAKENIFYLHRDHIGSIVRVTDKVGSLAARFWFDPWGKPVASKILDSGNPFGYAWNRGLGGHEHLSGTSLIHMNGRVYDLNTGMFLSADPAAQQLAKYGYANNNPLQFIDPTGESFLGALIGGVVGFITGGPVGAIIGVFVGGNDAVQRWVEQNWRTVVIVAAAVVLTAATGGNPILAGMLVGAATGALSSALYGGNFQDILEGAIRGAVIGGVTAGAFHGVGEAFSGAANSTSNTIGHIAAHGTVGGALEAAQGGDFWQGFAASVATQASSRVTLNSVGANTARAAIVGGTVASISGGNFANGAIMGAFAYTFNEGYHHVVTVNGSVSAGAGPVRVSAEGGAALSGNFESGDMSVELYYTSPDASFGSDFGFSISAGGSYGQSVDAISVKDGAFWQEATSCNISLPGKPFLPPWVPSGSYTTNKGYWAVGASWNVGKFSQEVGVSAGTSQPRQIGIGGQFNIYRPASDLEHAVRNMLWNHANQFPR